jgi:hypothetical protein
MPIVLRIAEETFAASIARHFELQTTFSVAALAAPVFAGLSRVEGARGRIEFDGQEFGVAELLLNDGIRPHLPRALIPLASEIEEGEFRLIRDINEVGSEARVLMLVPLAKVRENPEPFLAAAEAAAEAERAMAQTASSHQIGV